jgi:Holliday junction resolvase RusA-like endonuclease
MRSPERPLKILGALLLAITSPIWIAGLRHNRVACAGCRAHVAMRKERTMIRFFVAGIPKSMSVGKSFAFRRKGDPTVHHFQKRNNSEWGLMVGQIGRQHAPIAPLEGALVFAGIFYLPSPSSIRPRDRATALPIKRPDIDNLMHKLSDHFNGIFWRDDSQVTDIVARKRYDFHHPQGLTGLEIIVAPVTNVQLQAELDQALLDVEPSRI